MILLGRMFKVVLYINVYDKDGELVYCSKTVNMDSVVEGFLYIKYWQCVYIYIYTHTHTYTWVHGGWLRLCATCWKVVGLILAGVIVIFHWHPSGCTMALGSTQPLTDMSTRNVSWGIKAAGVEGWQPYHLHVPIVMKSGSLNLLETWRPVQACNGIVLYTYIYSESISV